MAPDSELPTSTDYAVEAGHRGQQRYGRAPLRSSRSAWARAASTRTYANPSFAYGEINNNLIHNEFDATIVEVAFHDNTIDALLLRDPKARNWIARSVLHGFSAI